MVNLQAKDIEYYDSIEQLLEESDLVETDCHIVGWNKKFRIRALTFGKMDKVNKLSIDEKTGALDELRWVAWSIVEGVIRPNITFEQAMKLLESKNGEFVRKLSDQIWKIGGLNKKIFDAVMKEETELANETAEDNKEQQK